MCENLIINTTLNFKVWSNWHSSAPVWHKLRCSVVQPANAMRLQKKSSVELTSSLVDNGF